jgi:hypothetical protein
MRCEEYPLLYRLYYIDFSDSEAYQWLTRIKYYIHCLAHLEVNPEKYCQIINGRSNVLVSKPFLKLLGANNRK